jgi:putative transposase
LTAMARRVNGFLGRVPWVNISNYGKDPGVNKDGRARTPAPARNGGTMSDDVRMPQRRKMRMEGYDYRTPGAYFVTSCTELRWECFGNSDSGTMVLSALGKEVEAVFASLAGFYKGISVDAFVVMPNHVHAIISILGPYSHDPFTGGQDCISLPQVMQRFKSYTAKIFRKGVDEGKWAGFSRNLWQRSYHDIIIRDSRNLERLKKYIVNNPMSWGRDKENPRHVQGRASSPARLT